MTTKIIFDYEGNSHMIDFDEIMCAIGDSIKSGCRNIIWNYYEDIQGLPLYNPGCEIFKKKLTGIEAGILRCNDCLNSKRELPPMVNHETIE